MDNSLIQALHTALWADLEEDVEFYNARPQLAHYTSLEVLERILETNEIWFSNPLVMNDYEEVTWGIRNAFDVIRQGDGIRIACGTTGRHAVFLESLAEQIALYDREHLFNTYILCFSEHDRENDDGLLSMWRGYAAQGSGVALILDTAKLGFNPTSPLILVKVRYGKDERINWIQNLEKHVADFLAVADPSEEDLRIVATAVFDRIKIAALCSKHSGFSEEREWRAIYMSDRDTDPASIFKKMFHYHIGPRGIEPKLRLKLEAVGAPFAEDLNLQKLVCRLLVGPTRSTPIALATIHRMLELKGKAELCARVRVSSIPLRPS